MRPEQFALLKEILLAAAELPTSERDAYLSEACGGDQDLRKSVEAMLVHAEDTDDRWHVTMAPDGITTRSGDGPADATLAGDASDLYLVLWNRGEDSSVEVTGDRDLLDTWHKNNRIRWS